MFSVTSILITILIAWIFIRTMSFALWNWKHENKFGACMTALIALVSVVFPVYVAFFRT